MQLPAGTDVSPVPTLAYRSAAQSRSWRWPYSLRLPLIGAFTGAAIGLANVAGAVVVWVANGQPSFYFRGWADAKIMLALMALFGAAAGAPLALLLAGVEHYTWRRVRPVFPATIVVLLALGASTAITTIEFSKQKTLMLFPVREGAEFLLALGMFAVLSRRRKIRASPAAVIGTDDGL